MNLRRPIRGTGSAGLWAFLVLQATAWPISGKRRFAVIIPLLSVMILAGVLPAGCNGENGRMKIDLSERLSDDEMQEVRLRRFPPDVLMFGFDLRARVQEDVRQYRPLLEYLERKTGYEFALRFTPTGSMIEDDLGKGVVQLAAIGAGSYVRACRKYGVVALARGLNLQGNAEYRSVIVVAPGSEIRRIEDLRGKRFAFGGITSTQGHLIPRIVLADHGIELKDLAAYEYTGSHWNCANAVADGRFDAGGMQDTMGGELAEKGTIRIIYTSRPYPSSCIAANKDVPPEVLDRVKEALLDFKPKGRDAAGLYHWERTEMPNGFTEAVDEDYAELREWARKFGMLEEAAGEARL